MGNITTHMCVSIQGMLDNHKRKGSLNGAMTDTETGRSLTHDEVRAYLHECLAKGWKVIPMCDCNNFDYQTGCKGHTEEEMKAIKSEAELAEELTKLKKITGSEFDKYKTAAFALAERSELSQAEACAVISRRVMNGETM